MPKDATTISISIDLPWTEVYAAIWRPQDFPRWASGLSAADLRQVDGEWRARGPGGPVTLRFTDRNPFGIMDHWVHLASGVVIHVPMRIVENGGGAEVMITLFRPGHVSPEAFASDANWVRRDLENLRDMLEP